MTSTATKMTPEQILAALQQARAKMPDAYDLPRTLSQRQVDTHETRRAQFDAYIRGLQSVSHSSAADLYATRDYLLGLWVAIEKQITEAPDPATIADWRMREKEEERQRYLPDALEQLRVGVGYWPNGAPQINKSLADLMTKPPCAACGHQPEVKWPGTIPAVEEAIAAMEKKIDEERVGLDALLRGAAALLAEPMTS